MNRLSSSSSSSSLTFYKSNETVDLAIDLVTYPAVNLAKRHVLFLTHYVLRVSNLRVFNFKEDGYQYKRLGIHLFGGTKRRHTTATATTTTTTMTTGGTIHTRYHNASTATNKTRRNKN